MGMGPSDAELRDAILTAVHACGSGKTLCPSEVARALAPDWRPLMPRLRQVAEALAEGGHIATTQKGKPVPATQTRGPIRLGLPQDT